MEMDLSISIVNWNTKDALKLCLKSIYDSSHEIEFEVFVIDNNSSDSSAEMVMRRFPSVRLIRNKVNLGFARANNQAIKKSRGRDILLLNPDIVVLPNSLARMVNFMRSHSEVGAAGGKLLNPDGTIQKGGYYRRFPSVMQAVMGCTLLNRITGMGSFLERYYGEKIDSDTVEVDQPPGACLMVRREVIGQVGLLDEDFNLWFEDVDWCYRIKKAGWKIFFYPEAEFIHRGGQSVKSLTLYDYEEIYTRSMLIYFKKHKGWLRFNLLRHILLVNSYLRLMISNSRQNQQKKGHCVKMVKMIREI